MDKGEKKRTKLKWEKEQGEEQKQCVDQDQDQDSEGHFSVKGSPSNEVEIGCNESRRRVLESFSLSELHVWQRHDAVDMKAKRKSYSVQGTLNDETRLANPYYHSHSHSHSDSSFNYEPNLSEEKVFTSEYKYRSLESVDSSERNDCNSIQVNFDEGSTFNSPKEEDVSQINSELQLSSNFYQQYQQVNNQQASSNTNTNANHSYINCWSSETLNGNADGTCLSHTPSLTSISSKSSQSRKRKKSHSSRQRRRKFNSKANDSNSSNSVTQCSISNPDIARRKLSLNKAINKQEATGNWSILPIFKQLIVQKHQGSGTVNDVPVDETRQMSSCPNLSIKCDVVEYF